MVVMTAKVSKTKLIAVVCILAAIICIAIILLRGGGSSGDTAVEADAATNEGRIAYLSAYGWEVDPQPVETQEVLIPGEMNDVFAKYNELQRSQGFDLTRFAGKQVKRYVYTVTNYLDASAPVYATLLVSKGDVIGGDITSTAGTGSMHGFSKPDAVRPDGSTSAVKQSETPAQQETETPSTEETAPSTGETPITTEDAAAPVSEETSA